MHDRIKYMDNTNIRVLMNTLGLEDVDISVMG